MTDTFSGTGAPIPLRSFLRRVIWICVLPLVLLAAYLALDSVRNEQRARDAEAADLAQRCAATVDENLKARIGALSMLAASPLAERPAQRNDLYREAQAFQHSFGSHVILADPGLRMLFNTRLPFGASLPQLPRPKGRSAALGAIESGAAAVGDTFVGPLAREPMVAIAVPGMRDGKLAFLLLTVFETGQFQRRLEQLALPSGWSLALLDSNGATIARRGPPAGADAGRIQIRSSVAPWSVQLEIPARLYRAPLLAAGAALALAILGATLGGVFGGMLASRRLGRSMASLTRPARPGQAPPRIAEIAAARALLDESAQQRALAEAAQRESERRLRATFEQAAVGLALLAPDGRWLRVNQKLCQITGYDSDELLDKSFQDITHPDDLEADLACMRQILAGQIQNYAMEKRYCRKDGGVIWINLTVALVRRPDGGPDYFISVVEDIARRKAAESALLARELALHELNASLEQRVEQRTAELSNANRELDAFAHSVSHDLRAPLRAMRGFALALLEDYGAQLDAGARGYLEQIGAAGARMSELIDAILALSRCTRGVPRRDTVDLSALAGAILAELAHAEPGRAVAVTVEPGLQVRGDARMADAVMRNLLDNAWKYTARTAAPAIRVCGATLAGRPAICVGDNGAGFDMAHAAQLFEPFGRLHRQDEFPGLGIGLATVQRIVRRHGGALEARAAPGAGATFCFTLADPGQAA